MESTVLIKDFMNPGHPVSPDTSLLRVVDTFLKEGQDIPVINTNGSVAGIISEHDLTVGEGVYFPSFLKLLQEVHVYGSDLPLIREELEKTLNLTAKQAMNPRPLLLHYDQSIEEAIKKFNENPAASSIIIVGEFNKFAGILSRRDLLRVFGNTSKRAEGRELEVSVNQFMKDLQKEFVLVSKFRTRYWLLLSVLFIIVGFVIAFALILKIK